MSALNFPGLFGLMQISPLPRNFQYLLILGKKLQQAFELKAEVASEESGFHSFSPLRATILAHRTLFYWK